MNAVLLQLLDTFDPSEVKKPYEETNA